MDTDKHRFDKQPALARLKRWPKLIRNLAGVPCFIWSGEHRAYWREGGKGYTTSRRDAWCIEPEEALRNTRHCGPEKQIAFESLF